MEEKRKRKIAEQDNRDLLIMFETLNKEENTSFPDNPEMAMFWEMEKDVIRQQRTNQMASIVSNILYCTSYT